MKPEITKTEDHPAHNIGRPVWLFFACLTIFVYFFGLNIPFLGPDEPRYAQIAREMLERGDWITPTLGGYNWFEKPPLLYWLEMISYKLFGVSEFAARLGPTLCGLGTAASLFILERFVSARSNSTNLTRKKDFAFYFSLIAVSTFGTLVFSRAASFDIVITFSITAALVSFFIFDQTQPHRVSVPLVLFYVFIGIALLAKGLIGAFFPFAIVGFYFLLSRCPPNRTFLISLIWGTLLSIAIASVWYVPMYQRHGDMFINEFLIQHHFQRFTTNKYQHPQPFYFFFWVLPLMTLPWLPFFLTSICRFAGSLFYRKDSNEDFRSFRSILTFSFAWMLVPLIFFSFSGSKLPGYILPSVPAAIILTSTYVIYLTRSSDRWRNVIFIIATLTFGITVILQVSAVPRFAESDSVKTLIETANARGYDSNRLLMLHTLSHNAEFYAAGRLFRDADGKQRRLSGVGEVIDEINAESGRPVLVLIPLEYLSQLTTNEKLNADALKDNGELAIVAVSLN